MKFLILMNNSGQIRQTKN